VKGTDKIISLGRKDFDGLEVGPNAASQLESILCIALSRRTHRFRFLNTIKPLGIVKRGPEIISALHVHPELPRIAERPREHQGCIRSHRTAIGAQFVDSLATHAHCLRQPSLRKAQRMEKFLAQHFTDRHRFPFCHIHDFSPIIMRVKINFGRFATVFIPVENQPPLAVDSDRVLAFKPPGKRFKPIAWGTSQIGLAAGIVNQLQFLKQAVRDVRRNALAAPVMKIKIP
jgi:hypothetical protein